MLLKRILDYLQSAEMTRLRIETIGGQGYNCVDLVSGNGALTEGQGGGFQVVTVDLHVVK